MINSLRKIRKILRGGFIVKTISINPVGYNSDIEINFHRGGQWGILGFSKHRNHSYMRRRVSRLNQKLLNLSRDYYRVPFLYSNSDWRITYHFNLKTSHSLWNYTYLAYLIWLITQML